MLVTGKCGYDGCQADITPAKTQAQFNRNRGLHLKTTHGVVGKSHTPEGRRKLAVERLIQQDKGSLPVEPQPAKTRAQILAERRRLYQERYREQRREQYQKLKQLMATNNQAPSREAVLKYICPECGCRVWTTRGTESKYHD